MTAKKLKFLVFLFVLVAAGCSTPVPLWHLKAEEVIRSVHTDGAPSLLPSEYSSLVDTFAKGENLLLLDQVSDADQLFKLAILKGELLSRNLLTEKTRLSELERIRILEQQQREKERLESLEKEKEIRRREAEVVLARIAEQARLDAQADARRQAERLKAQKEHALVTIHTVKRGESLPQISALPEVYSDAQLWPLIYRANRDQIRDPRNLWPGQTLRIPRNASREDIQEARRYSQERRLH